MPGLVLYGIRMLAPAITRNSTRHRGGPVYLPPPSSSHCDYTETMVLDQSQGWGRIPRPRYESSSGFDSGLHLEKGSEVNFTLNLTITYYVI